jgi:hypothetical protein
MRRPRNCSKQGKKERFTALFHHISIVLLEDAFYELKQNAAPGVDRLTWTDSRGVSAPQWRQAA